MNIFQFNPVLTENQKVRLVLALHKCGYDAKIEDEKLVTDASQISIGIQFGWDWILIEEQGIG